MNPWGKVLGGVAGFALGGPLGAVVGLLIGHTIDSGLGPLVKGSGLVFLQHAFFETTFRLVGHLAKADGRVSEKEVEFAERLMARMGLSTQARRRAIQLFSEGKQPEFDAQRQLTNFARASHGQPQLRRLLLEILIDTGLADGRLRPESRAFLDRVARRLDVPGDELESMLAARGPAHSRVDPYAVLGVDRTASMATVKRAYRRLLSRHHPDKLVSQGLPPEMMEIAARKTREIRAAYDQIKAERGVS